MQLLMSFMAMFGSGNSYQQRYRPTPEEYEYAKVNYFKFATGENHPFYCHHLTDEHKASVSKAQKGRKRTDEEKEIIRRNTTAQFAGNHEVNKIKFSSLLKRAPLTTGKRLHPVVCIETGETFVSISETNRQTGYSSIKSCCLNYKKGDKSHTAGGYHWRYLEDI